MNPPKTIKSEGSVREAMDRLISTIESKGMTVFARIDHADNALKEGMSLRPTELIIFGNPKTGTLLMQDQQATGIDLPLKVLVWEDKDGNTCLTWYDTIKLAESYSLSEQSTSVLKKIDVVMDAVAFGAAHIEK